MKTRNEILGEITAAIEEQEEMSKQAWGDNQSFLKGVEHEETTHEERIEAMTLAGLSRIEAAVRDSGTIVALALMAFVTQDDEADTRPEITQ